MSLENNSLWVKIFEGSLSNPDGFKITESYSPKIYIPIDVFSSLYKVVASCPNSRPYWWLAGSLVERAGQSQVLDVLEVGRYVVPRDREVLLRPRFNDVPFYYNFEPAYWHTLVEVTVWAWVGDDNQTPKSSLGSEMFAIASSSIEAHLGLTNPHGITLQLLGAASKADLDGYAADIEALQRQRITQAELEQITGRAIAYTDRSFEEHLAQINPHGITPEDIDAVRKALFEELENEVEVLKNQSISSEDFGNLFSAHSISNETLPITPAQIGAVSSEELSGAIAQHLDNFHQQEDGGSFSPIGVAGKFYDQKMNFIARPDWQEIMNLKISRGKLMLTGMIVQNWEGLNAGIPDPTVIDISSNGVEQTIQYQSIYLHLRLQGNSLQVRASGRHPYPLVQFSGRITAWGFPG